MKRKDLFPRTLELLKAAEKLLEHDVYYLDGKHSDTCVRCAIQDLLKQAEGE